MNQQVSVCEKHYEVVTADLIDRWEVDMSSGEASMDLLIVTPEKCEMCQIGGGS